MTPRQMSAASILRAIATLQQVQRESHPEAANWREASAILADLFAECARRYPLARKQDAALWEVQA